MLNGEIETEAGRCQDPGLPQQSMRAGRGAECFVGDAMETCVPHGRHWPGLVTSGCTSGEEAQVGITTLRDRAGEPRDLEGGLHGPARQRPLSSRDSSNVFVCQPGEASR